MMENTGNMDFGFGDFEDDIIDSIEVAMPNSEVEIIDKEEENKEMDKDVFGSNQVAKRETNAVSNDNFSFSFDFGSLGIPGMVQGDIGLEISRYAVDKLKFSVSKREMINIVSPQVLAIKCHYIEGLGSIICNGKTCCEKDGMPRIKYLFPVVVYSTDSKGRPVDKTLSYKVLAVGKDTYESIMTKHELQGDITKVDLVVSCQDENYQKIQMDIAGECRWKKDKGMAKEVVEFWQENMKELYKSIARNVTDKEVREALSVDTGLNESDVDFKDVFGD